MFFRSEGEVPSQDDISPSFCFDSVPILLCDSGNTRLYFVLSGKSATFAAEIFGHRLHAQRLQDTNNHPQGGVCLNTTLKKQEL
jgi:hypothetical protein